MADRNRVKEPISCAECGKEFLINSAEKRRQLKKGRTDFFCRMSHHASFNNKKRHPSHVEAGRKTLAKLREMGLVKTFIPLEIAMRYYLRHIRKRRYLNCDLTMESLISLWEKQEGRCALTNLPLKLKEFKNGDYVINSIDSASLDRIDSSEDYLQGNVQFVAYGINLAKSTFTNEEVRCFLDQIRAVNT